MALTGRYHNFKLQVGPGGNVEPVITVMLPNGG
jgi:hypothetical protein